MNTSKCIALAAFGLRILALPTFAAPSITGVTAQQRYPWNGKVDIAYTVSGDIPSMAKDQALITELKVTATDNDTGTTYTATALSGDTGLSDGTHTIVWDMDGDGIVFTSSNVVFSVSCETTPATYCVIDLSAGANASSYPVTYLAEPPSGGFNTDEYKTTKLVLKRIEAGTFKMGGSVDVTLTKPFFIGLFEVTQKQYSLIRGSNPSNSSGDKLPVERVGYSAIRGSSNGAQWPASNAVDSTSFLGKLRARTGLGFDLPTEAQWEYACRAGTTTVYSYGDTANGNYMWYSSNNPSSIKPNEVGTKSPNPWGLYDMHGNVWEWCLDWYNSTLSYGTDPKGSSSGSDRVQRGGSWARSASVCTSSYRGHFDYLACGYSDYGFRLACAEIESFAGGGETNDAGAMADALDCTNLEFTISGPRDYWVPQTDVTHDGVDAVRCDGILSDGGYETNTLALTVCGPGQLSFWWKVDTGGDDSFTFEFHQYEEGCGWIAMAGLMADDEGIPNYNWAGGEGDGGCSSEGDWVRVVCNVGEGEHTFRWFVATISGGMFGNKKTTGRGFLDCVSWTPHGGGGGTDEDGGNEGGDDVQEESRGLSVKYFDCDVDWRGTEEELKTTFAAKTPVISANSLDWGATLDSGFSIGHSYDVIAEFGTRWEEIGFATPQSECRFHGKYATSGTDDFSVWLEGFLDIEESGIWNFAAQADDLVVLFIDGERILDYKAWEDVATGSASLSAGLHTISIGFQEYGGGQGVVVQWKRQGDSRYAPVPQSALSISPPTAMPTNGVYTETVNGIEWTYSLQYGRALIGTGLQGQTAIPATTAGPLTIPSTLGGCPVTRIRDWAFANCQGLTSVIIPGGVRGIGDCAFSNCTEMAEIAIPDGVASIGVRAFYYCGSLRSISIPYGIERIEQDTFSRCFSLSQVSLPDSLKSIGKWAFSRCDSLESITFPPSLETIEHGCFDESRLLTSVTFPASLTRIDSWAFARTGFSSFSFPATVTKVDNNMFFECTNLVSVAIPSTVTSIGGWVFQRCRKLESLTIPDSVTKIGDHAFLDCSALPTLRIPSGVTEIGGYAFQNCSSLRTLYLPERFRDHTDGLSIPSDCTVIFYSDSGDNGNGDNEGGGDGGEYNGNPPDNPPDANSSEIEWYYSLSNGKATITGCSNPTGAIRIPANVDGHPVETIGYSAFYECIGITSVTIPTGVTSIGRYAFQHCPNLRSVEMPQSVTSIGFAAFQCSGLMSVSIPNSVVAIGDWAFDGCPNYTSIVIPNSVVNIGIDAFSNCQRLKSLVISNGVEIIAEKAFERCPQLETAYIPATVYSIGQNAFWNCPNLVTLYLPRSLQGAVSTLGLSSSCTIIYYDDQPDGPGFADALDGTFEWTSDGEAEWTVVEDSEATDGTCARSGAIDDSKSSWIGTEVEGPGTISFRWKVSSQARLDRLSFSVDGETKTFIAGTAASVTNWTAASFDVEGEGSHALRWTYTKSASGAAGEDCGWIDDVRWTEAAPDTSEYGEALDAPDLEWTVGGADADAWVVVDSTSYDGEDACAAFANGAGGLARIATEIEGPGTISFRWRVESGTSFAGIAFMVDGEDVEYGESEAWSRFEYAFSGEGRHSLAWEYFWDGDPDGDAGFLDCVSWVPDADELIPDLGHDATSTAVTNAIESAGFADAAAVKGAIGGSASRYADFKAWAQGVAGGEAAVLASHHAAVSWLLGAAALFAHEPEIRIASLALANAPGTEGTGNGEEGTWHAMSVTVEVRDGEEIAYVDAAKVAGMLEATSDLDDWNGKAKLTPSVGEATRNPNGTMTFTLRPGDGTARRAFLRIRVK